MAHLAFSETAITNDSNVSGVSWGAVVAGAFVAAAMSLALLALGTGIGFSAVSPWGNVGASATTIGWAAVIWLVLMEIIASSTGGYLAGRLRTKWVSVHTHEVYFRDTAPGFLVWALGFVITVVFFTSPAPSMVSGSSQLIAAQSSGGAATGPSDYFVDSLFRSNPPSPEK